MLILVWVADIIVSRRTRETHNEHTMHCQAVAARYTIAFTPGSTDLKSSASAAKRGMEKG